METSIKRDVRTILDILHQQQQQQMLLQQSDQTQQQPQGDKPPFLMTASFQPSESDFSFDLFGLDSKRQRSSTSTSNVHRSISQPECANTTTEKSLLR